MLVPAWAFSPLSPSSDGTDIAAAWSDPTLHEGVLSTDPTILPAVSLLQALYPQLQAANNTFMLLWGSLDANIAFLKDVLIIANIIVFVVYFCLTIAWAVDYYYLFLFSKRRSDEEENLYLLKQNDNFYYNG